MGRRGWFLVTASAATVLLASLAPPAGAQTQSSDTTLSELTVTPSGGNVGFEENVGVYHVGVASTVEQVTVRAVANHPNAQVSIPWPDADPVEPGFQRDLDSDGSALTLSVTAEDGTSRTYIVNIYRGTAGVHGWKAEADLHGLWAAGHEFPIGVWSDGDTMWVADDPFGDDDTKVFAYRLPDGERQPSLELSLADQGDATGVWSDGDTMWVADFNDERVYAYRLSDGERQESREISLPSDSKPFGLWSDGVTIWVADHNNDTIIAYRLSDGERQESRDLSLPSNFEPAGIWSDGVTMWVTRSGRDVFAYRLRDGQRQESLEFSLSSAQDAATGLWSDGATMWVADVIDEKVYAYNWPASDNTDLAATISGKTYSDGVPAPERAILGDTRLIFEDDLLVQQVSLEPNLAQVTTSLEAPHFLAEITALDLDDADSIMPDHQLELHGTLTARAEIQVTVTAQDGTTSTRSVVFTSQQCHGGMGAGRVAVNDEGICVILDTVLVQVADGFTVDEAADALLADFPAWTITSRLPGLGVVHATHVPDNLTLAQLEDQIGQIESKAWAQEAGFDILVVAAIGSGSDSGSSGSGGSFGGGSFGGGFVSPPGSSFPPAGFGDTTGHRFAAAVRWLAAQGITAGCAPGSFCPDTPVTRAQMASFLARALELDPAQQPAGFTDVDPQSAHATNIDALHAAGITAGCTQQPLQYCPDSPVPRAQMASFLARALELDPAQQPAGFTDVDPQSPHATNIDALHAAGITAGCTQQPLQYCPDSPVPRAQMAAFLFRARHFIPAAASG